MTRAPQQLGIVPGATDMAAAAIASSGGTTASTGILAAAGGPIGIGIAAAGLALQLLLGRKRGQRKEATTAIVNDLEPVLQQNLSGYLESPRTAADQQAALIVFDEVWRFLISSEACGNPQLGTPGDWCIEDRAPGGKHDWHARYRDPIANDTPRPATGAAALDQLAAGQLPAGSSALWLGIAAAAILGGLLL